MREFPSESYEISLLKIGKSGKIYDLSFNNLKIIEKIDLIDLLTNKTYNLVEKNIINNSREQLLKKLNTKLLKFHHPDYIKLFGILDPRKKNLSDNEKKFYTEKEFPKSIITTLTHGSYLLPKEIEHNIRLEVKDEFKNILRLIKNYSDFGTKYLVINSFIPSEKVINVKYGRGIKDTARDNLTQIRKEDFYKNTLPKALTDAGNFGHLEYIRYHLKIDKLTNLTLEKEGGYILIDDHDTGILNISIDGNNDTFDEGGFPLMTLGTLDGYSCNNEIVEYYSERIEYHLGVKSLINTPYKGGYVTKNYGAKKREKLKTSNKNPKIANVIQQEIARFLYLDEITQEVNKDKAIMIGIGLARAKSDLGRKFGNEYFEMLNKGDDYVKKYLDNYKEIV